MLDRLVVGKPAEPVSEIGEADFADPAITIFCGIAFGQNVGRTIDHKLRPAELAVVVVIIRGPCDVGPP